MGAETSRAEPEKGRNLWGSNPKRAETSGNPLIWLDHQGQSTVEAGSSPIIYRVVHTICPEWPARGGNFYWNGEGRKLPTTVLGACDLHSFNRN